MLNNQLLNDLRRKQFILMNVFMILALGFFGIYLYLGYSSRVLYIILAALYFVLLIRGRFIKRGHYIKILFFSSLKPLIEYEREKLGEEWQKIELRNSISYAVLLVIFVFQAMIPPVNRQFDQDFIVYFLAFSVFMMILINVSHCFHVCKVDLSDNESIRGYANKSLLFAIIAGLFVAGVTIVLTIN